MKKTIGMMVYLMASAAAPCFAANDGSSEYDWPPPTGMLRGVANIVTSPCEVARDIFLYGGKGYEMAAEPGAFFGGVLGIIPGTVMCAGRIADGVLDCFTLGIWGNSVTHSESARDFFPTFSWEDLWLPESLSQE